MVDLILLTGLASSSSDLTRQLLYLSVDRQSKKMMADDEHPSPQLALPEAPGQEQQQQAHPSENAGADALHAQAEAPPPQEAHQENAASQEEQLELREQDPGEDKTPVADAQAPASQQEERAAEKHDDAVTAGSSSGAAPQQQVQEQEEGQHEAQASAGQAEEPHAPKGLPSVPEGEVPVPSSEQAPPPPQIRVQEQEGQQGEQEEAALPPPPTPSKKTRSDSIASQPGSVSGRRQPPPSHHTQPSTARASTSSNSTGLTTPTHSRSSLSSLNKGSAVFVIGALETIANSRESRKNKELKESCATALNMIKTASASSASAGGASSSSSSSVGASEPILDPRTVFEPLRLACATGSAALVVTAVDCIGKLVSYSFFAEDLPGSYPPPHSSDSEAAPAQAPPGSTILADLVTETVCSAPVDASDDKAQLQIIKALLSIVLSTSVHVHQGSLLKAIRTVYNIFQNSRSPATQAVAQGSLTQMVHHVFGRVPRAAAPAAERKSAGSTPSHSEAPTPTRRRTRSSIKSSSFSAEPKEPPVSSATPTGESHHHEQQQQHSAGQSTPAEADTSIQDGESVAAESEIPLDDDEAEERTRQASEGQEQEQSYTAEDAQEQTAAEETAPQPAEPAEEKVTLQMLERRKSFEGANERDTLSSLGPISANELFVKDAFLVLRALCKLSMKPVGAESERDLRSQGMRSKLLSLHLILTILKSHMAIFQDERVVIHSSSTGEQTPFVQATKQYLCLSLSRNAVSSTNQIFELACEIFWLVLSGMRSKMKVSGADTADRSTHFLTRCPSH